MHALKQLDVDREVEGNLALFLFLFEFGGLVLSCRDSLSEEFLVFGVLADVSQDLM